jgi:hypothetical protein
MIPQDGCVYVHQRTNVTSITTDTLFVMASPVAVQQNPHDPPWSLPSSWNSSVPPSSYSSAEFGFGEPLNQPYGIPTGGMHPNGDEPAMTAANLKIVQKYESSHIRDNSKKM